MVGLSRLAHAFEAFKLNLKPVEHSLAKPEDAEPP